jgi:hypothetical protein
MPIGAFLLDGGGAYSLLGGGFRAYLLDWGGGEKEGLSGLGLPL